MDVSIRSINVVVALAATGCAIQDVKPWERGDLARPEMQWEAGLVDEGTIRDHVYVSKEAASMGPVVAGGGCGCN